MFRKPNEGVNPDHRQMLNGAWHCDSVNLCMNYKIRKQFINCKCPKCSIFHDVYMLWSGRGTPRKYCTSCRPLVSGYDDVAFYEVSIHSSGHLQKRRSHHKSE